MIKKGISILFLLTTVLVLASSSNALWISQVETNQPVYSGDDLTFNVSWYDYYNPNIKASIVVCANNFPCNLTEGDILCKTNTSSKRDVSCTFKTNDTYPSASGSAYYVSICPETGVCNTAYTSGSVKTLLSKNPFFNIDQEFSNIQSDWEVTGNPDIKTDVLYLPKDSSLKKSIDLDSISDTVWEFSAKASSSSFYEEKLEFSVFDADDLGFRLVLGQNNLRIYSGMWAESRTHILKNTDDYHDYKVIVGADNRLYVFVDGKHITDKIYLYAQNSNTLRESGEISLSSKSSDDVQKVDFIRASFTGGNNNFLQQLSGSCSVSSTDLEISKALSESDFISSSLSGFQKCSNNDHLLFSRNSFAVLKFDNLNISNDQKPNFTLSLFGNNSPTWSISASNNNHDFVSCDVLDQTSKLETFNVECPVNGEEIYLKIKMDNPKSSVFNFIKSVKVSAAKLYPEEKLPLETKWDFKEDFKDLDDWVFSGDELSSKTISDRKLVLKTSRGQAKVLANESVDFLENSKFQMSVFPVRDTSTIVIGSRANKAFVFSLERDGITIIGPNSKTKHNIGINTFKTLLVDFNESSKGLYVNNQKITSNLPIWENVNLDTGIYINPSKNGVVRVEYFYAKNGTLKQTSESGLSGECTNQRFKIYSALSESSAIDSRVSKDFSDWLCDDTQEGFLLSENDFMTFLFQSEDFEKKQVEVNTELFSKSGASWTLESSSDNQVFIPCENQRFDQYKTNEVKSWVCNSSSTDLYLKLKNVDAKSNLLNYISFIDVIPTDKEANITPVTPPTKVASAAVVQFTTSKTVDVGERTEISADLKNTNNNSFSLLVCTDDNCDLESEDVLCQSEFSTDLNLSCSFFADINTDPENNGDRYYVKACNATNACTPVKKGRVFVNKPKLWDFVEEFDDLNSWTIDGDSNTTNGILVSKNMSLVKKSLQQDILKNSEWKLRLKTDDITLVNFSDGSSSFNLLFEESGVSLLGSDAKKIGVDTSKFKIYELRIDDENVTLRVNKEEVQTGLKNSSTNSIELLSDLDSTLFVDYIFGEFTSGGELIPKTVTSHVVSKKESTISDWNLFVNSEEVSFFEGLSGENNLEIVDKEESTKRVVLRDYNLLGENLDISNLVIETDNSGVGRTKVSGISLRDGETKAVSVQKVSSSNKVCVFDNSTATFDEVTNDCSADNEVLIECPKDPDNSYWCEDHGDYYLVGGLNHSILKELPAPSSPSGGGGSSSGGGGGHSSRSSSSDDDQEEEPTTTTTIPDISLPKDNNVTENETEIDIIPKDVVDTIKANRLVGIIILIVTAIVIVSAYLLIKGEKKEKKKMDKKALALILILLVLPLTLAQTIIDFSPKTIIENSAENLIMVLDSETPIECFLTSDEGNFKTDIHGPFGVSTVKFAQKGQKDMLLSCTSKGGSLIEEPLDILVLDSYSRGSLSLNPRVLPPSVNLDEEFTFKAEVSSVNEFACDVFVNDDLIDSEIVDSELVVNYFVSENEDIKLKTVCKDVSGLVNRRVFNIDVEAPNSPPTLFEQNLPDITVDQTFTFAFTAEDVEEDELTFDLLNAPEGMSIAGDGKLQWTPSSDQTGLNVFTVVVMQKDDHSLNDSKEFDINVVTEPVEEPESNVVSLKKGINLVHFPNIIDGVMASDLAIDAESIQKIEDSVYTTFDPETGENDFELKSTQGYLINAKSDQNIEFEVKDSEPTKADYSFEARKMSLIGVPFETGLKYSDLKNYIDGDYIVMYYDHQRSRFASYTYGFDPDNSKNNRVLDPKEGIMVVNSLNDSEFTLEKN